MPERLGVACHYVLTNGLWVLIPAFPSFLAGEIRIATVTMP